MTLRQQLALILAAAALAASPAQAQSDGVGAGNATAAPNPFLRRSWRERGFFNANGRIIQTRITSECTSQAFSVGRC